jgi:hypothetical protein
MPQDIIPDSHKNRLEFFQNLKEEIAADATTLGLNAAALTAINAILDPLITAYQTLVDAETAVDTASADAGQVFGQQHEALRELFASLKANSKFTDGMGAAMHIFTQTTQRAPADIQPRLKGVAEPGHVRITGSKDYAETVNISMAVVGSGLPATIIGHKRKKFPFDDQTPLKTPGVPEIREYSARGVIGDEEVGKPSDIVRVTFGG